MAVAVLAPRRCCHPRAAAEPSSSKEDHRAAGGIGAASSYKILRRIGHGGHGAVSLARHVDSGELVAIKSSLDTRGGGAADAALLLREAAMLAACAGNPAVVRLREVVRDDDGDGHGDLHIVMEYVPGRSLDDVMESRRRRRRPFTESETRAAVAQLLAGVAAMHARGVVHRDLKPGNVLVGAAEDGGGCRLRICDLGLSTSTSVAAPPADTDPEGTPGYMAPELLLGGGGGGGAAVDVWAIGCIMAELVAGEPLFPEEDLCQQLVGVVSLLGIPDEVSLLPLGVSGPSRLRERVPEEMLSPAGFDVLRGLLEYDPMDRLTAVAALKMPWFAGAGDD